MARRNLVCILAATFSGSALGGSVIGDFHFCGTNLWFDDAYNSSNEPTCTNE